MSISRADLFAYLDELGIGHETMDHAPVFTVEEGAPIKAAIAGGHTKNLFLKDKAGQLFLICALGDTPIKLNRLHPVLGSKRLSFGKPDLMKQALGVAPGSVTLFALINDKAGEVKLVLDKALLDHDVVNFHPLLNDATTSISAQDMLKFARASGHEPQIIDFKQVESA